MKRGRGGWQGVRDSNATQVQVATIGGLWYKRRQLRGWGKSASNNNSIAGATTTTVASTTTTEGSSGTTNPATTAAAPTTTVAGAVEAATATAAATRITTSTAQQQEHKNNSCRRKNNNKNSNSSHSRNRLASRRRSSQGQLEKAMQHATQTAAPFWKWNSFSTVQFAPALLLFLLLLCSTCCSRFKCGRSMQHRGAATAAAHACEGDCFGGAWTSIKCHNIVALPPAAASFSLPSLFPPLSSCCCCCACVCPVAWHAPAA